MPGPSSRRSRALNPTFAVSTSPCAERSLKNMAARSRPPVGNSKEPLSRCGFPAFHRRQPRPGSGLPPLRIGRLQPRKLRQVVDDDIGIVGVLPFEILVIGFGGIEMAGLDRRRDTDALALQESYRLGG